MNGRVGRRMVEKNQMYHAMSMKEYQKTAIFSINRFLRMPP